MRWGNVVAAQDEGEWFAEYVATALTSPAPSLPPRSQHIGVCEVTWFETEPGLAFISATGGSTDDRTLATTVVREQLRGHGIARAQYSFDWDMRDPHRRQATWDDIMAKAKRLIQSGQVQILRNGANNIVGHVQGDHGDYQTEIGRDDPNSRAITTWQCDCPWDQYAWQRTRQWKKYEGRPCAHVLATYWASLSTPVDEDAHPAQQSLFDMPGGPATPKPSPFRAPQPAPQGEQMMIPGMMPGQATGTPPMPSGPDIIPPNPMDAQQQVNPASVPGLRQPSPTNPVQYPGGTFSKVVESGWDFGDGSDTLVHVAALANGQIVQTKQDDWGVWQGKSEDHGAGQQAKIPKNSIGEVLGVDPTTGMVNVLFMGGIADQHGPLMPYGATAWFFPSELIERPDIKRPGPAIRRRR